MTTFKPILFNTEMVIAILENRKTRTRRWIPLQPEHGEEIRIRTNSDGELVAWFYSENPILNPTIPSPWGGPEQRPRYQPGDILWVRETWLPIKWEKPEGKAIPAGWKETGFLYYATDELRNSSGEPIRWKPSIHMPKEAARIFLKVEDVSCERLQSITEEEAQAEGVLPGEHFFYGPYVSGFVDIWEGTLTDRESQKKGWDANPWVWVYKFTRVDKPAEWEDYIK